MSDRPTPHLLLLASALLLGGCAVGRPLGNPFQEGSASSGQVTLHVTNLNFLQATLYGVTTGGRRRLGTVEGERDSVLRIPMGAPAELQIEIDLLAGPRCYTERIWAEPGDVLELTIQEAGGNLSCRIRD